MRTCSALGVQTALANPKGIFQPHAHITPMAAACAAMRICAAPAPSTDQRQRSPNERHGSSCAHVRVHSMPPKIPNTDYEQRRADGPIEEVLRL
jgi:hypothetical protein